MRTQIKSNPAVSGNWLSTLYQRLFGRLRSSRRLLRFLLSALLLLQLLTVVVVVLSTQAYQGRVVTQHALEVIRQMVAADERDLQWQLSPAQNTTSLLLDQLEAKVISLDNPDQLERTLLTLLRSQPQLSSIFLAGRDGTFLFVQRRDTGYFRKWIHFVNGVRQVELLSRKADLTLLERKLDNADPYQPQSRPWYTLARSRAGGGWTAPYVFHTSGQLGITAARAHRTLGGKLLEVVGVDIQLDNLPRYLSALPVGSQGRAFLVTEQGQLITVAADTSRAVPGSDASSKPQIQTVGGPPQALLERSKNKTPEKLYDFSSANTAFLGMVAPLQLDANLRWQIGVYVPKANITGSLERLGHTNVLIVLGSGILFLLLALPLLRALEQPFLKLSRYQSVFEGALHIRALLNPSGEVLEVSAGTLEESGLTFNQIEGQPFVKMPWFENAPAQTLEHLHHDLERAATGFTVETELNLSRAAEQPRQVEVCIKPLPSEGKGVDFLLVELRDITERKQIESVREQQRLELKEHNLALEATGLRLAEADAFKTRMVGIVSHDLKNPIAALQGYMEFMLEREQVPEQRQFLSEAYGLTERMQTLVMGLLDQTALSLGKFQLEPAPLDFSALVGRVADGYGTQMAQKAQTLERQIKPGLWVHGDSERLEQVLDNLFSNAVKFSPLAKTIRLLLEAGRDGFLYLALQDEGPGLNTEDKQRVFGLFERLSAQPTAGESSSGLGLAIVKQLVELHGGQVSVESRPGEGATFTLRLPRFLLEGVSAEVES
jgi:PAS domain S-box-containing protein